MRVELDDGQVIELGTTETSPTIGITDYSRRVTDDFGVTTVVPRGFARRMSVRLGVPFDEVDALQRRLADLRATSARWVADDRFDWLSFRGFYRDFDVGIATAISMCTLTVEGLADTEQLVDAGGDPAPEGSSTLLLLAPIVVDDAVLVASSVPETELPAWGAGTSYPIGARVMRTHRIWESLTAANAGHDPATDVDGRWLDLGATNRFAAFDQALGSATGAAGEIAMTLQSAEAVTGLAVLDTDAGSVRVQAPGYDRTRARMAGDTGTTFLFLDLDVAPGAAVTVTIYAGDGQVVAATWSDDAFWDDGATWADTTTGAGTGSVAVGTVLIGSLKPLGITETSPTAGITDYSRKVVDDFGEVTVVPRAWAKRMSTKSLIRTDAVDLVADRIANVRARPCLWVGLEGVETLTIYGFFKDFQVEVGAAVSKLSLSIEGLSTAAPAPKPAPPITIAWPDITDPTGEKPANGATVGMTHAESTSYLVSVANAELQRLRDRALSFGDDGASVKTQFSRIGVRMGEQSASIEDVRQVLVGPDGAYARALMTLDVSGRATGFAATNDGKSGSFVFTSDTFAIETPDGKQLFYADEVGVKMHDVEVDTLKIDTVGVREVAQGSVQKSAWAQLGSDFTVPQAATLAVFDLPFIKEDNDSALKIVVFLNLKSSDDLQCDVSIQVDGMIMQQAQRINLVLVSSDAQAPLTPFVFCTGILAGQRRITVKAYNREADNVPLTVVAGSTVEITELRKAALGSITGTGAAVPPQGSGGTGTGTGGGYAGNNYHSGVANV